MTQTLNSSAKKQRRVLETMVTSECERRSSVDHSPEATAKRIQCMFVCAACSHVDLEEFVEMTKKYAQGVAPSRVMAAAGDEEDDDAVHVKNPDELPLPQKVKVQLYNFKITTEHRTRSHFDMFLFLFCSKSKSCLLFV